MWHYARPSQPPCKPGPFHKRHDTTSTVPACLTFCRSVLSQVNPSTFSDPQNHQYWPTTNSLTRDPSFFQSRPPLHTVSTYIHTYILYSSTRTQSGAPRDPNRTVPWSPRQQPRKFQRKKTQDKRTLETRVTEGAPSCNHRKSLTHRWQGTQGFGIYGWHGAGAGGAGVR